MHGRPTKGPAPGRRAFTVLDAMILVACVAFGLAIMGWICGLNPWSLNDPQRQLRDRLRDVLTYVGWFLIPPSLAPFLFRLHPPGRPNRRCLREPGVQVSFALLMGVTLFAIFDLPFTVEAKALEYFLLGSTDWSLDWGELPSPFMMVGDSVLSTWILAALLGRRRPRAEWDDRLGRILGWTWIFLSFANSGMSWFTPIYWFFYPS